MSDIPTPRTDAAEIVSHHPRDLGGWPNGRRTGVVPVEKMAELEHELTEKQEAIQCAADQIDRWRNKARQENETRIAQEERANRLEHELAEARADLVYEQGGIHATAGGWAAKYAEAVEQRDTLAARFTKLDQPKYSGSPMMDEVLATPSEEFRAWVDSLPSTYWARYDLSAARIGWEAALATVKGGES